MTKPNSKHLLAALVVGFGVTLTACGSVVANGAPTTGGSTPSVSADSLSADPTTTVTPDDDEDPGSDLASGSRSKKTKKPTTPMPTTSSSKPTTTPTYPTTTTTTTKPHHASVVSFTVVKQPSCPVNPKPGAPFHSPGSPVVIAWKVTGAPKAALSVDNPGLYGSYAKDLPATGQLELSFPCDNTPGKTTHTYTIYPAGFPHVHKTLTVSAQNNV
jgi:hypothetical protein